MISEIDNDDSGKIEFNEFLKMMTSSLGSKSNEKEDIEKVFQMFSGKKKQITIEDLKKVAENIGEHATSEEDLLKMIEKADSNNKGYVDFDDF